MRIEESGSMRSFLFLFLVQVSPASGQAITAEQSARIDSVFATWDHTNTPGCALGIERGGEILYQRGYGMANLETGQAITPGSIFHVASISKQFAAASIVLLASRGKLSLDDDIRKYVPEIPNYGTPITIRQLLTHTSGLRDQWVLLRMAGWRQEDLITEDDVLWVVAKQKALNFTPGAEYLYSNTGYTLAGTIVKRVSGMSLRQFADTELFRPLGMLDTHFHDDHAMVVPRRTSAYVSASDGYRVSIPDFDTYGATSLFTTVGDLLKWEHNFATGQVLGLPLLQQMQQITRLTNGTESSYGLGLSMGRHRGLKTVGHSGADHGYRSDVVRFIDHDLAITALCNLGTINPSGLTRRVAEVMLASALAPEPVAAQTVQLSRAQQEQWAGNYLDPVGDQVQRIVWRSDSLVVLPSLVLRPVAEERFMTPDNRTEYRFRKRDGRIELELSSQPPGGIWQRQPAFGPDAPGLRRYVGEYRSEEVDARWTVESQDSVLRLKRPKFAPLTLRPVLPDGFVAEDLGMLIRFTRGRNGTVTGFTASAGRVRKVWFEAANGEQ
jgi:CubicO group peptidase (beta-lactamase class C family)